MVTTTRHRTNKKMSGSAPTVPLANLNETDIDVGIDDGFAAEGVDDGLAEGSGSNNGGVPRIEPRVGGPRTPSPGRRGEEGGRRRGYFPVPNPSNKPYVPTNKGSVPLDVNLYATKKTVAQGMMDLALLTANANQLRYVLESGVMGGYYYNFNIVLISASIIFQVVIGIALIFLGRYNVTKETQAKKADILNNWIVLGVFLISVVNVFISAFGIEAPGPALLRHVASGEGIPEGAATLMG